MIRNTQNIKVTNHIIFLQLLRAGLARGTVPNKDLKARRMGFNFVPPLHYCDGRPMAG